MTMRAIIAMGAAALILLGCSGPEAMLDARGDAASRTADLWWFMAWLGGGVYLVVLVLIGVGVQRSRAHGPGQGAGQQASERTARRLVLYGAVVGPALVLVVLHLVALPVGRDVAVPHSSTAAVEDELVIEVVAEKFWWRVHYPDHGVETANEVHMPTGRSVRIRLTSADVIHSFWIPRLAGKIDATPGHTTEQVLRTDEPGR
jgi:cytochrome c oxidase subunit II